ncbi:MAG TPA: hypothetical protein VE995_06275 [Gaiellaceae bacterium]|nr:hypothetical protein [Gaiellaceae bacterium]
MGIWGPLGGTPYFFSGRRTVRQQRLLSYIRREHRRGRHLSAILDDAYVRRCGSPELVWQTLRETPLLELLERDVREAFERAAQAVSGPGSTGERSGRGSATGHAQRSSIASPNE